MFYHLKQNTESTFRWEILDQQGLVLATFDWREGDWSFGLRFHSPEGDRYAAQRHVETFDKVKERIRRIFDETDLKDEVQNLRELRQKHKDLFREEINTTNSERYEKLTGSHGLVMKADRKAEIQADIVTAKLFIVAGCSVSDLRNLGLT